LVKVHANLVTVKNNLVTTLSIANAPATLTGYTAASNTWSTAVCETDIGTVVGDINKVWAGITAGTAGTRGAAPNVGAARMGTTRRVLAAGDFASADCAADVGILCGHVQDMELLVMVDGGKTPGLDAKASASDHVSDSELTAKKYLVIAD